MKKLYFIATTNEPLLRLRQRLGVPVERFGHYELLSNHADDQRHPVLGAAEFIRRSDMLGLTWRGAFWAAMLVLFSMMFIVPHVEGTALRGPAFVGFPIFVVAFGAWLGGLLGLMRRNPEYRAWSDELASGSRLLGVAIRPERERLLRKQMAELGWQFLAETNRYAGSYRFPQNAQEHQYQ